MCVCVTPEWYLETVLHWNERFWREWARNDWLWEWMVNNRWVPLHEQEEERLMDSIRLVTTATVQWTDMTYSSIISLVSFNSGTPKFTELSYYAPPPESRIELSCPPWVPSEWLSCSLESLHLDMLTASFTFLWIWTTNLWHIFSLLGVMPKKCPQ